MRNLLALVGLLVVGGAGLGWYLGWYKVGVQAGSEGKQLITIDMDTRRAAGDVKKFGESVIEFVDDKAKKAEPVKDETKKVVEAITPNKVATPPTGVTIQLPNIQIGGQPK